jgi:hypothetical protein
MKTLSDIQSTGTKTVTTRQEMRWSKVPHPCVLPADTTLTVHFSKLNPSSVYFEYAGALRRALLTNAHKNFTGFNRPPGLHTLEKWNSDGVVKTPTGQKVEPDGWASDGSPSWFLVLGVI